MMSRHPFIGKVGRIVEVTDHDDRKWLSRVLEYYNGSTLTRVAVPCRGAQGNPCHAGWPYTDKALRLVNVDDWADHSTYSIGDTVTVELNDDIPQYYKGTQLQARLISPHIEMGDWYASFDVPRASTRTTRATWRFERVFSESEFVLSDTGDARLNPGDMVVASITGGDRIPAIASIMYESPDYHSKMLYVPTKTLGLITSRSDDWLMVNVSGRYGWICNGAGWKRVT